MSPRKALLQCALFATVLAAACSPDSPTAVDLSAEQASYAKGGQSGGCTFVTPNGKAHTASSNSARCPAAAELAGTYDPTRFILHEGGETFDFLDYEEVLFDLTLNPDGTTSGLFYVPPTPGEDGSGIDVDLSGTWRLDGNQVTFDFEDEAYIDELTFTVRGKRLVAEGEVAPHDPFGLEIVLSPR